MFIENQIDIQATSAQVWDALINPEKTKIYMFGCETVSDWQLGSELLWQGQYEGKEMVFVKGNIVAIEVNKKLVYSVFDPNTNIPDLPENYLEVSYELNEHDGKTTLSARQGDYSKVAEGEKRYQESYNNGDGWNPILMALKNLVETTA